jgi:hypothetical protein
MKAVQHTSHNLVLQEIFNIGMLKRFIECLPPLPNQATEMLKKLSLGGTTIKHGTKKIIFMTFLIQPTK